MAKILPINPTFTFPASFPETMAARRVAAAGKKKGGKVINASVAVIGGGISGLVCANRLKQLGVSRVVCFDTGKRACGGRCSSRVLHVGNSATGGTAADAVQHICDHAAQYFTVTDKRFERLVLLL